MKIGLAVALAALGGLGWIVFSMNASLHRLEAQNVALSTALAQKSAEQGLALQKECSESANRFMASRGPTKPGDWPDVYENHYSPQQNRCFVLLISSIPNQFFTMIELYDALERKRYAVYMGHSVCGQTPAGKPRCAFDSGNIWFDGNEERVPSDFVVGFRGEMYGGGAGDENTQRVFLEHVRAFMKQ